MNTFIGGVHIIQCTIFFCPVSRGVKYVEQPAGRLAAVLAVGPAHAG
jgi:hypothetical protein